MIPDSEPEQATRRQLNEWYRTRPAGRRLRRQVVDDMQVILDDWFGYHMLVIGADPGIDMSSLTRVRHITHIVPQGETGLQGVPRIIAADDELPVDTEAIDVVVVLHGLELTERPHQLLREVHRVLTPHGHLLIVGSNPYSLRGLWRGLTTLLKGRQSRLERPAPGKLVDWLSLLNFSVAPVRHKLVCPFSASGRPGQWLEQLDSWLVEHNIPPGSAFLVHANKTVQGHISTRQTARTRARLTGLRVAKPVVGARGSTFHSPDQHLRSLD